MSNFESTSEIDDERKFAVPAYKKTQLHFCGRLDDIAHIKTEHLEVRIV